MDILKNLKEVPNFEDSELTNEQIQQINNAKTFNEEVVSQFKQAVEKDIEDVKKYTEELNKNNPTVELPQKYNQVFEKRGLEAEDLKDASLREYFSYSIALMIKKYEEKKLIKDDSYIDTTIGYLRKAQNLFYSVPMQADKIKI